MPFVSRPTDKYHQRTFRKCLHCDKQALRNIRPDGRNKGFFKTCGSKECLMNKFYDPIVNAKKAHHGVNHPFWIKDRTKVKQKRLYTEERWFFKEVLADRNYKCELTGLGGQLSVHHIKPVWKYPELQFNKDICIVILKKIHQLFHKVYGFKSDEKDWVEFLKDYGTILI